MVQELQLRAEVGRQGESLHEGEVRQSLYFLVSDPRRSLLWLRGLAQLIHWDVTPNLRPAEGTRDFPGQSVYPSQETALFVPAAIPKLCFYTWLPRSIPRPLLQG